MHSADVSPRDLKFPLFEDNACDMAYSRVCDVDAVQFLIQRRADSVQGAGSADKCSDFGVLRPSQAKPVPP